MIYHGATIPPSIVSQGPVKLYPPQWACGLMFHMHFQYRDSIVSR